MHSALASPNVPVPWIQTAAPQVLGVVSPCGEGAAAKVEAGSGSVEKDWNVAAAAVAEAVAKADRGTEPAPESEPGC